MSDDATKSVQVDEALNTEVAAEPVAITKSEDTTVAEDIVQTEEGNLKSEGGVAAEGDIKAESQNGADADKDVKQDTEENQENPDVLKTTAKVNYSHPRNNNKFDPSLAPVTDDPTKMPSQIRTQVR